MNVKSETSTDRIHAHYIRTTSDSVKYHCAESYICSYCLNDLRLIHRLNNFGKFERGKFCPYCGAVLDEPDTIKVADYWGCGSEDNTE